MKNEYLTSYHHLEIATDCTWPEVRRAYKRLVKKWHPDHFHNDARAQSLANEKIKEINCAFGLLSVHYRTYGVLPSIVKTLESSVAHADPDYTPTTKGAQNKSTAATQGNAQAVHYDTPNAAKQKNRYGIFVRLVFIFAVVSLGYASWQAPPESKDHAPAPGVALLNTATDKTANASTQAVQGVNYFTYGSTVGEVYAIQGTPSKTMDNVWQYGKSNVYFTSGKVTRWEDDPSSPLRATEDSKLAMSTRASANTFSVGSTKAEVRAIQGNPLMEWSGVWEYGLSKVYFDGDRVRSWYDSPLNPLMIRK